MNILIAPDKFRGSMTAVEAAEAIARGVMRAAPDLTLDRCPLSDGGEGFVQVLVAAQGGALRTTSVMGPLGDEVRAEWGVLADGTAVLESAQVLGLARVPEARRDPGKTTSFGLGQLLRAALDTGARRIVIGLGGSATNDGGAGLAEALGVQFLPAGPPLAGDRLAALRAVDVSARDPRLAETELLIACDVSSPLTGPNGAALTFAAQKGAGPAQVQALDRGLAHLAVLVGDAGAQPGDGAAGGLGYGLRVFAGARMVSGAERVLDAVQFEARLRAADLVLTGEGSVDAQTAQGKILSAVCRRARAHGVPVVALVGRRQGTLDALNEAGLTACFSIANGPLSETDACSRGAALLAAAASEVVRLARAGIGPRART